MFSTGARREDIDSLNLFNQNYFFFFIKYFFFYVFSMIISRRTDRFLYDNIMQWVPTRAGGCSTDPGSELLHNALNALLCVGALL